MKASKRIDYILIVLILMAIYLNTFGVRMNQFVMVNNDGRMPVTNWDGYTSNPFAIYVNATEDTKYKFLVDRGEFFGLSLGDLVMGFGAVLFINILIYLLIREGKE